MSEVNEAQEQPDLKNEGAHIPRLLDEVRRFAKLPDPPDWADCHSALVDVREITEQSLWRPISELPEVCPDEWKGRLIPAVGIWEYPDSHEGKPVEVFLTRSGDGMDPETTRKMNLPEWCGPVVWNPVYNITHFLPPIPLPEQSK